jgi:hypothetical protein
MVLLLEARDCNEGDSVVRIRRVKYCANEASSLEDEGFFLESGLHVIRESDR